MKSIFKSTSIFLILTLAILMFSFVSANFVYAENTDLIIDLDENSKFDTYEDIVVYTSAHSLHVAKDNKIISLDNAFSGECLDVAIKNNSILLLYKENLKTAIKYYSFNSFNFDESKLTLNSSVKYSEYNDSLAISSPENDELFYILKKNNMIYAFNKDGGELRGNFSSSLNISDLYIKSSKTADDTSFAYLVSEGKLYYSSNLNDISLESSTHISSLNDVSSVTVKNSKVYVNTKNGIYIANQIDNNFTKLSDSKNGNSKISVSTINGSDYLFILDNLAIVQYLITDTGLEYYNKFDNSAFTHPVNYDLVDAAKVNTAIKVYSSPKNLQIKSSLNSGDYIILLCTYDDPVSNTSYYYICTKNNELGYIKKDSDITKVNANSNPETLKIGLYAQGLHEETKIYEYPFSTSKALASVGRFDQLVVLDNVGEVDGAQIWGYYKVSFVSDNQIITGYVKATDVSPYCSLKPPQVLKNVKAFTSSVGETVNIYALPSEEAPIVNKVVDGTSLELAEEYNESSEWTKIVYNDTFAYVKTASIQKDGLTSLQITVIVICIIVFVSTIIMAIIIVKRKHFGY